jgi:UDP-2,3-diacylglucosamine pyrophosphatase LpxH
MPGKFKIVVSDLHLGAGHVAEGNPLEDFDKDQEFAAFLDGLAAESEREGAEAELIVNGDAFEMLQVPHTDQFDPTVIYHPEHYHSSSELDSARKMTLIIAGHLPFFEALGRFAQQGPPLRSVTFIKGNHDINLHWPTVQRRIRQVTGLTGDRDSLLVFEERRISREGIYVEHGNQYAELVDRVEDMEEPHDHDEPGQLALPPGSWFAMDVFNQVEREKYWIDGVKPITALVWYALAYDFVFAAWAVAVLLRALPDIIGEIAFDVEDPRAALLQQLEDREQVAEMAARYEKDEEFRAQFNAEVARMLGSQPPPPADVAFSVTGIPEPVVMGDQVRQRVRSELHRMAKMRAQEEDVKLVVFGHTHDAGMESLPDDGVYINSGTWTWRVDFTGEGKETWKDLFEHPERFTGDRLLSYVRIDYDETGRPSGQLLAYDPSLTPSPEPEPEPEPDEVEEEPEREASLWDRFVAWLLA